MEKILKSLPESKRAEIIESRRLGDRFNADGSLKNTLDGNGNLEYNKNYISYTARGSAQKIADTLSDMSADVAQKYAEQNNVDIETAKAQVGEFQLYNQELSENGNKTFTKFKKALSYLNKLGDSNVKFAVVEPNSSFNGALKDGVLYIGADTFENGKWAGTLVHEYMHFEEGTAEYDTLVKHLESDNALLGSAFASVSGKAYGFDGTKLDAIIEKASSGEGITADERRYYASFKGEVSAHMGEMLLGSETFIDAIVAKDGNIAQKAVAKIKSLKAMFERLGNAEASAEYKFLKKAEDLYLKAAEKAGDARLIRYISSGELDEEEAQFNRKDIKSNNGRKEEPSTKFSEKHGLVWGESGRWRDVSFSDDSGRIRLFSEVVRGGEKLQKINAFAKSFYTKPKNADQSYLKKLASYEDISLFFSNGISHRKAWYFDENGKNLFVDENISDDDYVRILEIIKPLNRVTDPSKIAHISQKRWNYFVEYNPDAYVTRIRIQDFLDLSTEGKTDQRMIYAESSERSKNATLDSIQDMYEDNVYLEIDLYEQKVTDHEGRHRMTAFLNAGYEFADVFIKLASNRAITWDSIKDLRVKGQFNNSVVCNLDVIKAQSPKHAKAISSFFKRDDGNVRYSFKHRENSDNKNTAFNNENKQSDNKKPTSYTKAEAEAMVDGIMKNLFISEDYGGVWTSGELKNRAAVIKQAHAVLNGAEAGKRFGEALKFADYIIEHTALVENVDGNILEPCIQTLDTLRPYLHKLNLDNLKGEIQHHYDKDRSVYSRWSKRKGHCKFYVGC